MTGPLAFGGVRLLLLVLAGVRYVAGSRGAPSRDRGGRTARREPPRRRGTLVPWRKATALGVVAGVVVTGAAMDTSRQAADRPETPYPSLPRGAAGRDGGSAVVAAAGDISCPADRTLLEEERARPDSCRTQLTAALLGR